MHKYSELRDYQTRLVDFIVQKHKVALFVDMGLGKTIISLTALAPLKAKKTLIIAPLRVANTVWHSEAAQWEHTDHLTFSIVIGSLKHRTAALSLDADCYVINRENVVWLVKHLKCVLPFDTIIVDESSSFKSHASQRFKYLKKITPFVKNVILLTGTPASNGYMDLWSQLYLLDAGCRLGRNITAYRSRYTTQNPYTKFQYFFSKANKQKIQSAIKDICIALKAKDYVELPDMFKINILCQFPKETLQLYKKLEKEFITMLNDDVQIHALTKATLQNKLLQLCNGAMYDSEQVAHPIHDEKIKALEELVENNANENMLVAYTYKFDLQRIQAAFPDAVVLDKEGVALAAWNRGEIKMLLAHPASCGHGINAQFGGSCIVWFGITWSLELYQQFNARLYRSGQTKPVRIFHILIGGSVDELVVSAIANKAVTQNELLAFLKKHL